MSEMNDREEPILEDAEGTAKTEVIEAVETAETAATTDLQDVASDVVDEAADEADVATEQVEVLREEDVEPEELDLVPEPIAESEVLVDDVPPAAPVPEQPQARSFGMPVLIGAAAVALVAGLAIGKFALGGGGSVAASGETAVAEEQLDQAVGSYTYNGTTTPISAREVIESTNGSLSSAANEDGAYTLPTADSVLNFARSAIMLQEAQAKQIEVTDDDINQYVTQLGATDLASVAASYGMEEETVKQLLHDSLMLNKLRESVITADTTLAMPDAPTQPEEGKEDAATADYATYIIGLAGSEWDADKGAWASEDGPYAKALASYKISAKKATYEAAQAAYAVAYQQYADAQSQASTQWTDYVNGLFSKASIEIGTLAS